MNNKKYKYTHNTPWYLICLNWEVEKSEKKKCFLLKLRSQLCLLYSQVILLLCECFRIIFFILIHSIRQHHQITFYVFLTGLSFSVLFIIQSFVLSKFVFFSLAKLFFFSLQLRISLLLLLFWAVIIVAIR